MGLSLKTFASIGLYLIQIVVGITLIMIENIGFQTKNYRRVDDYFGVNFFYPNRYMIIQTNGILFIIAGLLQFLYYMGVRKCRISIISFYLLIFSVFVFWLTNDSPFAMANFTIKNCIIRSFYLITFLLLIMGVKMSFQEIENTVINGKQKEE